MPADQYHLWARRKTLSPDKKRYVAAPGYVQLTRPNEPLTHKEALTMRSKFSDPANIMLYPHGQDPHDLPDHKPAMPGALGKADPSKPAAPPSGNAQNKPAKPPAPAKPRAPQALPKPPMTPPRPAVPKPPKATSIRSVSVTNVGGAVMGKAEETFSSASSRATQATNEAPGIHTPPEKHATAIELHRQALTLAKPGDKAFTSRAGLGGGLDAQKYHQGMIDHHTEVLAAQKKAKRNPKWPWLGKSESSHVAEYELPLNMGGLKRWHSSCLAKDDSKHAQAAKAASKSKSYSRSAASSLGGVCTGCGGELSLDPGGKPPYNQKQQIDGHDDHKAEKMKKSELNKAAKPQEIGKTRSGKSVYAPSKEYLASDKAFAGAVKAYGHHHPEIDKASAANQQHHEAHMKQHAGFTAEDHEDAAKLHRPLAGGSQMGAGTRGDVHDGIMRTHEVAAREMRQGKHPYWEGGSTQKSEPADPSKFLNGARLHYHHLTEAQRLNKSEEVIQKHARLVRSYLRAAGLDPDAGVPDAVKNPAGVDLTKSSYALDRAMTMLPLVKAAPANSMGEAHSLSEQAKAASIQAHGATVSKPAKIAALHATAASAHRAAGEAWQKHGIEHLARDHFRQAGEHDRSAKPTDYSRTPSRVQKTLSVGSTGAASPDSGVNGSALEMAEGDRPNDASEHLSAARRAEGYTLNAVHNPRPRTNGRAYLRMELRHNGQPIGSHADWIGSGGPTGDQARQDLPDPKQHPKARELGDAMMNAFHAYRQSPKFPGMIDPHGGLGKAEDKVIGHVGKGSGSSKKPLDIGDGYHVHSHGNDANGNHSVWVSKGSGSTRKIQTNGNLPSIHSARGSGEKKGQLPISEKIASEIKDYHRKYHEKPVKKSESEGDNMAPLNKAHAHIQATLQKSSLTKSRAEELGAQAESSTGTDAASLHWQAATAYQNEGNAAKAKYHSQKMKEAAEGGRAKKAETNLQKGRPRGPRPPKPHNEDAVRELHLFADNDADLYRQMKTPIERNLANKMAAGQYDHAKAGKGFQYLADAAAQKYQKQFGSSGSRDAQIFTPADRAEVGRRLADDFRTEAGLGNMDHHLQLQHQRKKVTLKDHPSAVQGQLAGNYPAGSGTAEAHSSYLNNGTPAPTGMSPAAVTKPRPPGA